MMKKLTSKLFKRKLIFIILLFNFVTSLPSISYETCLIQFPYSIWKTILYKRNQNEAIIQFIPNNYQKNNYIETVIFHSYKGKNKRADYMLNHLYNKSIRYSKFKIKSVSLSNTQDDLMAYWCIKNINDANKCEIVRVTKSFEGLISMHYMTSDIELFNDVKNVWINALKNAKVYYSYYRWDRIMNRSVTFEL